MNEQEKQPKSRLDSPAGLTKHDFSPGIVPQDAIYGPLPYISCSIGSNNITGPGALSGFVTQTLVLQVLRDTERSPNFSFNSATKQITLLKSGIYCVSLHVYADLAANPGVGHYIHIATGYIQSLTNQNGLQFLRLDTAGVGSLSAGTVLQLDLANQTNQTMPTVYAGSGITVVKLSDLNRKSSNDLGLLPA